MSDTTSRRRFLGRSVQTLGVLAVADRLAAGRAAALAAAEPPPSAAEMTDRAVAFLKRRQDQNGGWSTDRKEPGITALVVTALLRSKRVTPAEPVVTRALAYLEQFL